MRWRLLQIILRYRLIICLEERIIRVYLNLYRLTRKFENSSFLRNRCGNLCENGRCGGLSMPPIPFFLLPTSPGWLVASYFCSGDICRRCIQSRKTGRPYLPCGTKSQQHGCFKKQAGQQAPGKPDPTRSIAPNQGYICRSRPHEGGGDTRFMNSRW